MATGEFFNWSNLASNHEKNDGTIVDVDFFIDKPTEAMTMPDLFIEISRSYGKRRCASLVLDTDAAKKLYLILREEFGDST